MVHAISSLQGRNKSQMVANRFNLLLIFFYEKGRKNIKNTVFLLKC